MELLDIYSTLERAASIGDIVKGFAGYLSISAIYIFIRDWFPKKVCLSIGSFVVRRKYFNVQNVTNVVSAKFYAGGQIPDEIRKEIIMQTNPRIWDISYNMEKTSSKNK